MLFKELNRGKCKTYLIADERAHAALLVDPLRDKTERYLSFLAYNGLKLRAVLDTHTHADHRTGTFDLRDLTGASVVMHRKAPAPRVDIHVTDGEMLKIGGIEIKVLHTPGHTPDSISLYASDRVLTGDTLFIGGTGRTDFAGGDAGAQYDSITQKLFALPDETLVFPGHDYRGNTQSTVGAEKRNNPRTAQRTREAYVELMNNLGLGLPDKIQEVLQPNQSALDEDRIAFPPLAALNEVRQLTPQQVATLRRQQPPPVIVDVREPEEYTGELGHIPESLIIPLKELPARGGEIEAEKDRPLVVVCRAGVRSTTAAAILTGLGFERVFNLKGGMIDWNDQGWPVER